MRARTWTILPILCLVFGWFYTFCLQLVVASGSWGRGGNKSWTLPLITMTVTLPPQRTSTWYCRSPRLDSGSDKSSLTRVQTMLKYCTHTVPWLHRNTETIRSKVRGCKYTEHLFRIHFYSTIHLQTTSVVPLLFGLTHTRAFFAFAFTFIFTNSIVITPSVRPVSVLLPV